MSDEADMSDKCQKWQWIGFDKAKPGSDRTMIQLRDNKGEVRFSGTLEQALTHMAFLAGEYEVSLRLVDDLTRQLAQEKAKNERLRGLLPDPRYLDAWDDPKASPFTLRILAQLCELKGIDPPEHVKGAAT